MKYKYATTRRNKNSLASFIGNKKHRCKKLLNSKNLVAGLITVVGSMLMMAQSEAQELKYVGGNANWGTTAADVEWDSTPFDATADTAWLNGVLDATATFEAIGGGNVTVVNPVTVARINLTSGYNILNGTGFITLTPFGGAASQINSASNAFPLISESLAGGAVTFGLYGAAPTGTVNLSGANTFSGVATVQSGVVLRAGSTGALGTAAGGTVVDAGGTLQLDGVGTTDALTLSGTGSSTLLGALDFRNTAPATISGNITLAGAGDVRITSNGPNANNDLTLNGNINGTGQNLVFENDRVNATGTHVFVQGNIGSGVTNLVLNNFSNSALPVPVSGVALYGANTYSGSTLVQAGYLGAVGGSAIPDASAVELTSNGPGSAPVFTLVSNETIGSLDGDATSRTDLINNTLTTGGNNTSTEMAGVISDDFYFPSTGNLIKQGTGTWTLSNANTYGGLTTVSGGVLEVTNNGALGTSVGAADRTQVDNGAQLRITGGRTLSEHIYAVGTGVSSTGAILSNGGNNTLNGPVFINGITLIANNTDNSTLTINGTIDEDTTFLPPSGPEGLRFQTNGVNSIIDVNAQINPVGNGAPEDITKLGAGIVDLRGSDHDHINSDNFIEEGVVRINNQNQLGNGVGGYDVFFRNASNQTSELQVIGGPSDYTNTQFHFDNIGVVGTISTVGGGTVMDTDFNDYFSSSNTGVLRKDGSGILNIVLAPGDLTPVPAPGPLSVCAAALFAPNTSDFAPGSGLIVDPVSGTVLFDNSGNARTTVTLNGLGNINGDANSLGTLQLDNVNLVINQSIPTTFNGNIVTNGPIGVDGVPLTINTAQPGITGQIVIINGGELTIGHYGALGSNGNYTANGTYVCGESTLALNALAGGAPLNERITLFNNANLVNNTGTNTIASEIFLHHDPLGLPNPGGAHTAHIGAIGGTLTLTGGIDAHNTPGDMNLGLNTGANDLGQVIVNSEIEATVVDLDIGNVEWTLLGDQPRVHLLTNNSYTGETRIHGGSTLVGNNNSAFSSGLVRVTANSYLGGSGANLGNSFQIDSGATLKLWDNFTISGGISGAGNLTTNDAGASTEITLTGANTYTGTTTVSNNAGTGSTLNVGNALASPTINVEALGTLNTNGTELLDNAATVNANGTWNLGGNETIGVLNGASTGVVDIDTHSLSVGSGAFDGVIQNAHGALNKVGLGTLTLTNNQLFVGPTHVEGGSLVLNGAVPRTYASRQIDIDAFASMSISNYTLGGALPSQVNIDNFGSLTLSNATLLAGSTLNVDGQLNVNQSSTAWNVTGASTGSINLAGGAILSFNGIDFDGGITGAGGINVLTGNLNLDGNSTFTGSTTLSGGTTFLNGTLDSTVIAVNAELVLGNNHGNHLVNNATVNVSGVNALLDVATSETIGTLNVTNGTVDGAGTINANTAHNLNGATVNANLGGSGSLASTGATTLNGNANSQQVNVNGGTLALNGELNLNSVNVTVANGAILNTGGNERINDNGSLTVNGTGRVNLGGDETIQTLNGGANAVVDINAHALTVSDGAFAGVITNAHGALNKVGFGTLTLTGANTYVGPTHVQGGTLTVSGGSLASTQVDIDGFATMNITNASIGSGAASQVDVAHNGTLNLLNANLVTGSTLNVDGTANVNSSSNAWNVTGSATGLINLNNTSVLTLNGINFDGVVAGDGSIVAASGNVDLGGNSTFTGPLTVNNGSFVNLTGTVDASAVTVNPGGELTLASAERIADFATLNANGILNLNGEETVATLNAAGLIRGNGKIQAATYNLNNGAITESGADLGDGVLNTNGTVLLAGNMTGGDNAAASTANVQSGILNLHGMITDPDGLAVNVSAGATLALRHDERIGDNAVLTSNGTVNLNGTETVTTFNLSGPGSVLGGTGLLNAATYNLANGATTLLGANMGLGVLNVSGAAQVTLGGESAAATVNINAGADLFLNGNERLTYAETDVHGVVTNANAAVINNLGTLTLGGTETVETNNMNGATLAGAGTLNAVTHNLTNSTTNAGTVLNGKGTDMGTLNLAGVNVLNGNANVGTVNVNATTTTLNGLLTKSGVVINIADPTDVADATLVLGAAERINNTAIINNDGTLTLNGTETIGTFNSSGNLNGAGTLIGIGNTVNLLNGHISFNGTTIQDFSGNAANPSLTSNGAVTINGTAGSQSSVLNARLNVNFAEIQSGTMFLNGLFIGSPNLTINNTATLQSGSADRVSNAANVTIDNGGVWNLGGNDTINTLSAGGQLNSQPHTLTALTYTLTGGADINANLGTGVLNSNNSVLGLSNRLDGNAAVQDANITSGVFNLNGQLTVVNTVDISNGATVNLGSSERIANGATVNNFGELDLNGNETVTTYNANGGFLDNSGTLTATTYNLSNGASTDFGANLGTGTLNSTSGSVTLNGNTNANVINIDNGVLTTNGAVQNANGVITVDPFASWNVNNTNFTYARLQGEGTVDALTIGTFVNENTVAPGQFVDDIGELDISGNYRENGTLEIEFNTGASDFFNHDVLDVTGSVTLNAANSILDLQEVGAFDADNIQCGERFHIIDSAGTINGAWSSIGGSTVLASQTFGTQVLFDLGSGDVVGTGLAQFETIADIPSIDSNQLAVLTAITDSAIDTVGNYDSSDAGTGNVLDHILQACDAGGNAGKLAAINSTMPEGYAGAVDYALHTTRSYTETIMQTTPFGARAGSVEYDEKGQVTGSTAGGGHSLQAFGGYHSMELASDSSNNGHDYDMDSNGGYAGVRAMAGDKLAYGAFIGVDNGSVDAAALNLDADGYVIGALAHYQATDKIGVWANLSYGSFSFDGHRRVFGTNLTVKEFDADAFQVGVGVDYEAYNSNGFKVTPGLGLRFIDASTDSITETGGPAALNIDGVDADALLLDLTVKFTYIPEGGNYGLTGYIGYQHDFEDGDRDIDAMFASGSPYFRVNAPGLGDSAFTYGIGGYYDFTEDLRFSVNYRGESRSDADAMHGIDLRLTYGF